MQELEDGTLVPLPGQGLRLQLDRSVLRREGQLLDAVGKIVRYEDGVAQEVTVRELREDPLLSASLEADFRPDHTEIKDPTTRVIQKQQYLCDQFVFSAADHPAGPAARGGP